MDSRTSGGESFAVEPGSDSITRLDASELASKIAAEELSATEVVEAHIRRIEDVNGRLNAIVVPLFEDARARARLADESQARGEPLGPLHGVPITIKESYDVAGTPTTGGLTSRAGHNASSDAPLVARLRGAGAIVLGKTNVPQLLAFFEADNPVYGLTRNPWNGHRSCGGSSGGEAAIIAAHGSPLGLGTDGGGSIRQPCHACGICGLKPTGGRWPLEGHFAVPNWLPEWIQPGPMARSVRDLTLAARVLSGDAPASAAAPKMEVRGLQVGYFTDDGILSPSPAARRAVEEAAAALERRGVRLEEFRPPDPSEAYWLYVQIFLADGLIEMRERLRGSRVDWRIRRLIQSSRVPDGMRRVAAPILEMLGRKYEAKLFRKVPRRVATLTETSVLLEQQANYRRRFREAMERDHLDALLCPPSALPALPHGSLRGVFAGGYTMLFNLLSLPAGVVPVTRVRHGEESDRHRAVDPVVREALRAEMGSTGLPVGVQIAARSGREDVVLALMEAVEAGLTAPWTGLR